MQRCDERMVTLWGAISVTKLMQVRIGSTEKSPGHTSKQTSEYLSDRCPEKTGN